MTKSDEVDDVDTAVSFIRDEPSPVDHFGAHSRLADAITDLLARDARALVIGILGPWGSGKSTAVKRIEDAAVAKGQKKTHFFTYDAWLHQADPVRRSFLEALVSFLVSKGRVDEKTWNDRLKDLNGAIEKTETENTPVLTGPGRVLVATLALVPLGVALIGYDAIKDAFADPSSKWASRSLVLGILFSLAPAIAALVTYISWRPWGANVFSTKFWTEHKATHRNESILGILSNRSIDRVLTVTSRQPEPSSIEFQDIFRELMKEASEDGHQFVFIVDNLDRINEAEALQIWGTIKGFFLGKIDDSSIKKGRYLPSIILPIDPAAIKRMFARDHGADADEISQAFMEKTFDVTFEVPEPIASDWRNFLGDQLRSALSNVISGTDEYWIAAFLDEWRRRRGARVTPRIVNKYINTITALYQQRASTQIHIASIAFYAAFAHEAREDLLKLLETPPTPILPGDSWRSEVAGVHYGVDPTKALQVLLDQPIRDALQGGASERLEELSRFPGFAAEFERVLRAPPRGPTNSAPDFTFITNAALMLGRSETTDAWTSETWNTIIRHYLLAEVPEALPDDLGDRILAIALFVADHNRSQFIDASAAIFNAFIAKTSVLSQAMNGLLSAADQLIDLSNSWSVSAPKFAPRTDITGAVGLLAKFSQRPRLRQQLRLNASASDVVNELVSRLAKPLDHTTVGFAVRTLVGTAGQVLGAQSKIDWAPLISAAVSRLRNSPGGELQVGTAAEVLGLLRATNADTPSQINALIDEGLIQARLNEAAPGKNLELMVSGYAFLAMHGPNFGPPNGYTWDTLFDAFPELPNQLIARLYEFYGPAVAPIVWAALKRAPSGSPLLLRLCDALLSRRDLVGVEIPGAVGALDSYLAPLPPAQRRDFLNLLIQQNDFWPALTSVGLNSSFLKLARYLRGGTSELQTRVKSVVQERLIAVPPEEWTKAITGGGILFLLATEFADGLTDKSTLFDSLTRAQAELLRTQGRTTIERWFALGSLLSEPALKKLYHGLAQAIASGGYIGNLLAIARIGSVPLLRSRGFSRDGVIRGIVVPLLSTEDGRRWVQNNAGELRPLIKASSRDAVAALQVEVDRLQRSKTVSRSRDALRVRELLLR